jgi:multidrug efflux pump subunit AcrB
MHLSAPFIKRPVATSLLSLALLLAGSVAYSLLPVASLPNVDFPVIGISAGLPGASPETMASSVATPLERQFGRIASVNQMTSVSTLGAASVVLQFDINRNIDAAARDVQAAINAARNQLPSYLPQNPSYRKANPAESPILILTLTSDVVPKPQIYDMADSILAQKIAQIDGVGQVFVFGSSSPAVRVELNPMQLGSNGIGLEAVRTALANANANRPKGGFQDAGHRWQIADNDQMFTASDYAPIIAGYNRQTGAPVRISDLGTVVDSVADIHTAGISGINPDKGPPGQLKDAVLVVVFKSPGANVISTVDNVMGRMSRLQASIPPTIKIDVAMDRTTTIRASVHDVEISLLISVVLVVLVVFMFLREVWATIIPSIAVPLSLVGTFGVMYLLGYTIDNLSLMALTIATGFVVDDAIVVIENITRYLEDGMKPFDAAMKGSREIGFTVLSMSTSLIAVFIPILLMGGIVGKLFREFAVTLSVAIAVSLLVSLTTTPMLCAQFLKATRREPPRSHLSRFSENVFQRLHYEYNSCAALGAAPPDADSLRGHRHGIPERISLHDRAQGLLSAAGHGPAGRPTTGRAGHQLPRHARQAAPTGADDAGRSGGRLGNGICGRQWSRRRQLQCGLHVCRPQAARSAPRSCLRRRCGQPPAPAAHQRARRHALSPGQQDIQIGGSRQPRNTSTRSPTKT